MEVNGKKYNLEKQAKEIRQDEILKGNEYFSSIFLALDNSDGKNDKKLYKQNINSIFSAMKEVDKQHGNGDNILSDAEIGILQKKLLPNLKIDLQIFKKFLIKLLKENEDNYINISLGQNINGTRQIGVNNISIRESKLNQPSAENPETNTVLSHSNERIDSFKQGQRGDCYLLSEINAIQNTKDGAQIFKKNIVRYTNGDAKITLPGALEIRENLTSLFKDKTNYIQITGVYKITAEAANKAMQLAGDTYSEGDLDVILYEMAFEAYRLELTQTLEALNIKITDPNNISAIKNVPSNTNDILYGGQSYDAGFLITGETSEVYRASNEKKKNIVLYEQGEFGFITQSELHQINAISQTGDTNNETSSNKENNSKTFTNNTSTDMTQNNASPPKRIVTKEIHRIFTNDTDLLKLLKKYSGKEDQYALTCYVKVAKNGPDGSTVAGGLHSLTVLEITEDTVYVLNPWFKNGKDRKSIEPIPINTFDKMCIGFIAHEVAYEEEEQAQIK